MNTGKPLESLVQEIEKALCPEGFSVEVNDKVFNDDGVQIAEFDIVISGNLGSSSVRWLVECRDRPSVGAAPISWIEQLYGRRVMHKFDKVFAVSTTGFAPGAVEMAERHGILLRTVKSVSDLSSSFRVLKVQEVEPHFQNVVFLRYRALNYSGPPIEVVDPRLRLQGQNEYLEITDFLYRHFDAPHDVQSGNHYHCCILFTDVVEMFTRGLYFKLEHLAFEVELSMTVHEMQVLVEDIKSYEEDGRVIGQQLQAIAESATSKYSTRVLAVHRPDQAPELIPRLISESDPDRVFDQFTVRDFPRKRKENDSK